MGRKPTRQEWVESCHLPWSGWAGYQNNMAGRVVIILLALLVAGCDRFYGVESRTRLRGPVDVRCVNAALATVPDVQRVTYQRNKLDDGVAHHWLYGENGADIVELIQDSDGWDFSNSRRRMGVAVPHEQMVRFVPLMQAVNQALQARCGLPVAELRAEPVGDTKPSEI